MRFTKNTQKDTSKVLRLPRKMTMDTSKVLRLPRKLQHIFWKRRKSIAPATRNDFQHVAQHVWMSRSATPATRNEATTRLKPPKRTTSVKLPIGTAIRGSRGRLRTVANGCDHKRNVERTHPQPPDPQSETGTLATHSGKNSFSWNKFHCGPILYSTLTDAGFMEFPWSFHAVSMQVSCWLHAGFADLAYWCVTSMAIPSNLHGICMEPPWNLHQSECMIKPTSVDRGITSITHMETAWNLHQFSMEPAWNLHENCIS